MKKEKKKPNTECTTSNDYSDDYLDHTVDSYTPKEVGALCCGLMFAAHKNAAIAAAQVVLFWCENDQKHQKQGSSNSSCSNDIGVNCIARATLELEKSFNSNSSSSSSSSNSNNNDTTEDPNNSNNNNNNTNNSSHYNYNYIDCSIYETLRLTAHTIGAVRKVVDPQGWKVTSDKGVEYIVPCGVYVGASHIIPHRHDMNTSYWNGKDNDNKNEQKSTNIGVGDRDGESGLDEFNPDRPNLIKNCQNDLFFTTFSHGIHKCPGSNIAIALIQTYIFTLLENTIINTTPSSNTNIPRLCFERATLAQRKGNCILDLKLKDI